MPYAPGVQPRGDMYLAQGAQQSAAMGNQALMALAQDWLSRSRQRKVDAATLQALQEPEDADPSAGSSGADQMSGANDEAGQGPESEQEAADLRGKKADALRKLAGAYHPQLATAVKGMSLEELEGRLKAYTIGSAMKEHAARMQQYQAQAQYRQEEAESDQQAGNWAKNFLQAPPPSAPGAGDEGRPDDEEGQGPASAIAKFAPGSPEDFAYRAAYASSQVPNMGGKAWAKAATALSHFTQARESGRPAFFTADNPVQDLPGLEGYSRVVTGPNTAQVVAKGGPQLVTLTDENGNTRTVLQNPKGGAQVLPEAKNLRAPESFHKEIDKAMQDYAEATKSATAPAESPGFLERLGVGNDKRQKQQDANQQLMTGARSRAKSIVDRYHADGSVSDGVRNVVYEQLGLQVPGQSGKADTEEDPGAAADGIGKGLPLPLDAKGKPAAAQMKDGQTYLVGGKPYAWDAKKSKLVAPGK